MTFQDRLEITTSEGVTVTMTIAGIGSRSLGWLLDGLLIGLALVLLGFVSATTVNADSLLAMGLLSLAVLVVPFAYVVGFETLNGGRTLGKMAAGIKVVRLTGGSVGFGSAVIRALFVPIDFLFFGVGIVAMFVSGRSQRLGDLAARTVVVRDRIPAQTVSQFAAPAPTAGPRWDVSAISDEEIGVIRSFLSRANSLPAGHRQAYAGRLRGRIEPRLGGVDRTLDDEAFLVSVVSEKQRED
jgi:uncharacterized RDD family membrane protein YckC